MATSRERVLETPPPPADLRLSYGPESLHIGDLRLPDGPGPHPVVVMVHGGFWRNRFSLDHTGHACAALTAAGLATWNIEYRRLGDRGGGWPGTFLDVARAADYVREIAPQYHLDLDRVVTMGHSAGGHLALWLAARSRIGGGETLHSAAPLRLRGAISLAGVVDLERAWQLGLSENVVESFMGGSPAEVPVRYATASPAALLPLGLRQTLIHGTDDETVPYEMSRHYLAAALARGDEARLIALPGAGHFEIVDPLAAEWSDILAAIHALLVPIHTS